LTERALGELEFVASTNAFNFQNRLFQAATGIEKDVWTLTPADWLVIAPNGTEVTSSSSTGYCYYEKGSAQTTLTYTYMQTMLPSVANFRELYTE
jgi:hypothetical protein